MRMLFAVLLLVVCLVGCRKNTDDALYGTWTFDREYTQSRLPKELVVSPDALPFPEGIPSDHQSMKAGLVKLFLDRLNGTTIIVTPQTFTDPTGRTQPYEIVARGDNNWSIKTSDGHIETWKLEHDRLSLSSRGDVRFDGYFSRVENQ